MKSHKQRSNVVNNQITSVNYNQNNNNNKIEEILPHQINI